MGLRIAAICAILLAAGGVLHAQHSEPIQEYIRQYHRLGPGDVEGRLRLAQFCASRSLHQQQFHLLIEALKLRPTDRDIHGLLLKADQRRALPVNSAWEKQLLKLGATGSKAYHSPHFTVISDLEADVLPDLLLALEGLYARFFQETSAIDLTPLPPGQRLVIVLLARREDYLAYLRRHEGLGADSWDAGHYSPRANRVVLYHDRDNPAFAEVRQQIAAAHEKPGNEDDATTMAAALAQSSWRSTLIKIRHEAAHQLLCNSGLLRRDREYPFWMSEGLACLFESPEGTRAANPNRVKSFHGDGWSIKETLASEPRDNDSADAVSRQYAAAWALVHYLWNHHPRALAQFIRHAGASPRLADNEALFRQCIADDPSSLDDPLRQHIATLQ